MTDRTLAQKLFHRLVKGYYNNEYIVLNDYNYLTSIWADSEEEAIKIFESGTYKQEVKQCY